MSVLCVCMRAHVCVCVCVCVYVCACHPSPTCVAVYYKFTDTTREGELTVCQAVIMIRVFHQHMVSALAALRVVAVLAGEPWLTWSHIHAYHF